MPSGFKPKSVSSDKKKGKKEIGGKPDNQSAPPKSSAPILEIKDVNTKVEFKPSLQIETAPTSAIAGYQNRHAAQVDAEKERKKQEEKDRLDDEKKTYSIDFMLGLRSQHKNRPVNMALLDFPHKKRRAQFRRAEESAIDKFNRHVGQIRILLNKLSTKNFDTIQKSLLGDFEYTPSLLHTLMKIIFMKSTTEKAYMEVYVRLCVILFKKFNDKENVEMNFRKLLLTRCEKQFYKMLKVEQEDRRTRRASMEEAMLKLSGKTETNEDNDFNKQMLFVYDESEIKARQIEQMHGNMQLIVELFKVG